MVKAALPDQNGQFAFDNVAFGSYTILISLTGYTKNKSAVFTIGENNVVVDLPVITLVANPQFLSAVTVEAKKPFVERKLDKLIVNVENSIEAAGNSVLEVLERAPGVVVNQETSINLQGKQGVIVMIDGKVTPLSGADLISYLKGISASNIATIEIITQPSARYDASGNAGIINIKFKKDQRQGFNGAFTLSYGQGTYYKPSASTNINYRKNKWNLFGNYSHIQPLNFTRFYINRKFFDGNHNLSSTFDQTSFIKQPITSDNTRFGADYYVSKKTVVGVLFNMNWNNNDRDGKTNSLITLPNGQLDYATKTDIKLDEKRFNGFGNFNLKHTFDSTGRELTADIDYGKFNASSIQDVNNANYNINNSLLSANQLQTDQQGTITVKSFKADYINPIKNGKFEAGVKISFVQSDNDVKFFDIVNGQQKLDLTRSNHFIYDENVNAAYTSFAKEFKKFDIQVGLRMEQTNTKGKQIATGEEFSRHYINFFPSFVMNRKFSDKHQLSFSYAKRIDRPSYRQLNPFKIFVDPYTYVVGDPSLKPVLTNSYELSHTFKNKYITALSYSSSKDVITDVFVQDDASKISYQTPANLQDFETWNLQLFIPITIKKWLNSNLSGNVYWNKYSGPFQGGSLVNDYTSWDVRLQNTFVIGKKGWSAELNGFYQAKNAWGLFVIRNLAQVTTGIQKVSKNKNSTFKLALTDIFYTNHISVEVKYQNMDFYTDRTWDSRVATLSFTHRFGKNTVTRARQRNSGVEDEKRRAN
jgi:outer membrane receptor protein involved in Fe transport